MAISRLQVVLTGPGVTGGGVSTYYFATAAPDPGPTEYDMMGQAIEAFWTQLVGSASVVGNDTVASFDGSVVVIDETTGDAVGAGNASQWQVQAPTTAQAPKSTQGLIQWRTGIYIAGKEVRGRTFIPAINQELVSDDGAPTSACVNLLNAAAQTMPLQVDGGTVWLKIYSPTYNVAPNVTLVSASNKFSVLKSRRD